MNKEHIPVITDREKLYDKCENMEQLFDKYYLPLLDKHYSKTYKLQQEKQELINLLGMFKNQQKEFINYMMNTIENITHDETDDEEIKGYLIQRIDTFKEIFSKYKSIIGDDK